MVFMGLREYINRIKNNDILKQVDVEVSKEYEIAGILKAIEPTPVLFTNVKESNFSVIGNLFCTKNAIASYFDVTPADLIPMISKAIDKRSDPKIVSNAVSQEVTNSNVDLDEIPILKHIETDGGHYISSAVVVTRDPEFGQNLDFHRAMQFSKNKMATRIVSGRHFHKFLQRNDELEVAFCVGNSPNVLIAAATSVDIGVDELSIANALEPLELTKAKSVDLNIPASCEFVLEGKVFLEEKHDEGPFVDLTETVDIVRQEPVFEVKTITHRKDAIWQALLPGVLEHKVLMGMPREPTIFKKVTNSGVNCVDVNINPGGCSWLHAIIQIDKKSDDDPVKAMKAAFEGHTSCKHVFIVDKDIDIYDPLAIEWAMATRMQGNERMYFKSGDKLVSVSDIIETLKGNTTYEYIPKLEPGSSLDPSAQPGTKLTQKIAFDLTSPLVTKGKNFSKVTFPEVDLSKYGL
jgi:2,5-furandicarboxylate decarboxylase 1